jgi:hypothetical protein
MKDEQIIKKIREECLDMLPFLLFKEDKDYLIKIWKHAQKERDLIWIEKLKNNVNFSVGDVNKILKEIER